MNPGNQATILTHGGPPVALTGLSLDGDLRGLLFEARVEQRFHNASAEHVEVVYSFPLPWGAVLLGVDVVLGGRRLQGCIVEKRQAEARYEEALSEGDAAIMLERNRDHSHSLNLGNLAPGERCSITLRYAQLLRFEQGGLRLLVPTVIAPRYGDPLRDGGLQPHQVPLHDLLVEHPMDLRLRLHGPLAQARVASPSHPIAVAHSAGTDDDGAMLTVTLARAAHLDRDVVLVLDQLAHDSLAVAGRDAVAPGGVSVLASLRPRVVAEGHCPLAVKLLVDCSGSMAGDSIAAARRALQSVVLQLGDGDRFALSRFGSNVVHRTRGLWTLTEVTRIAAQRWIGALEADMGGTALHTALWSTFILTRTVRSDVLLLTDGAIEAVDTTIAAARKAGHRVFVVGIGNAPAEAHLRRLAEATGGACDFVAAGEAVEPAVLRMFARLRTPHLQDLRLDWPAGVAPLWVTPLPVCVFDGDTVNVLALLPQTCTGVLRLLGRREGEADAHVISAVDLPRHAADADTMARMTASARCQAVDIRPDAASLLAVDYQLLTTDTNFLLVHQRDEGQRAPTMPVLQRVPQMMPAGGQGLGVVPRLAQPMPGLSLDRILSAEAGPFGAISRAASINPAFIPHIAAKVAMAGIDGPDIPSPPPPPPNPVTPLGLCDWLAATPPTAWPTGYDGLRQAGLHHWVIDWLVLVMARQGADGHREREVVAAFLFLMNTLALRTDLAGHRPIAETLQLAARAAAAPQTGVDAALVQAMSEALATMTPDTWPRAVLALDDVVS